MSLPPEFFRNLTPAQMAFALAVDEDAARHRKAASVGARCADCFDTGMRGGSFCGCGKGQTLGIQAFSNEESQTNGS